MTAGAPWAAYGGGAATPPLPQGAALKRLIIVCLSVAGLLGLSACATSPHAAGASAVPAAASVASRSDERVDRYCLRATGSRIVVRDSATGEAPDFDKHCLALGGRAYSREDIERTGEVDLADALRKLNPAIR